MAPILRLTHRVGIIISFIVISNGIPEQVGGIRRSGGSRNKKDSSTSSGEPLLLTPFIRKEKFDEARNLSRVTTLPFHVSHNSTNNNIIESYSGFLTVNSKLNSNLFFWFVPALLNKEEAPVLLWLNGGPGSTSMIAFFNEHGPYYVDKNMKLRKRDITWVATHSIIYMDSPVGAGFSFTEDKTGYTKFIEDVVRDLHVGITQFFTIFSEYRCQDFYVAGQSYAGKYAPAIAHRIHEENQVSQEKINLKGIAVGSGFFDPPSQINYADFYYQVGLIDEFQKNYFEEQQSTALSLISAGNWSEAFRVLESLIVGYPTPFGVSHFERVTGLKYNLNLLVEKEPLENKYFVNFLRQDSVRSGLHVGNQRFNKFNPKVYNLMHEDVYQSIKPQFINLLNWDYKVLVYASQHDAIVPYITVSSFLNSLEWKHSQAYYKAVREIWRAGLNNDSIAGYKKVTENLHFYMLRNAGHLAAQDQPEWTFQMISEFTESEKLLQSSTSRKMMLQRKNNS